MKGINSFVALLSGLALGTVIGILLAPDRGENTRKKIQEALEKKGIKLDKDKMKTLIDDIITRIKGTEKDYGEKDSYGNEEAEPSRAE